MKNIISVPHTADDVFLHIPPRLDLAYIESILARKFGRDITVSDCTTTNLCAKHWGGVSNTGATVLRLSLTLNDGRTHDLVAKILSPDSINLFKIDCRFSSRLAEVAWADWWGKQDVSWVPVIYDTHADIRTREFWIIQEFFPKVGWADFDTSIPKGMGYFHSDTNRLCKLMRQVALLHAYSRSRIGELRKIFPAGDRTSADACPSQTLQSWLKDAVNDPSFLSGIGVTDEERASLDTFGDALGDVPAWVEQWDAVCVTADWGPDNFGIRDKDETELVTFDWGTTRLAPMEEDIDVLFMRIKGLDPVQQGEILACYLDTYADRTGRRIKPDEFRIRIPWARFFVTLRYLLGHIEALRWVPHQTRSREFVHLFIDLCRKHKEAIAFPNREISSDKIQSLTKHSD